MHIRGLDRVEITRKGDDVVAKLFRWSTPNFMYQHLCNVRETRKREESVEQAHEDKPNDVGETFEHVFRTGKWSYSRGQFKFYVNGRVEQRFVYDDRGRRVYSEDEDDFEYKGGHDRPGDLLRKILYGFQITL